MMIQAAAAAGGKSRLALEQAVAALRAGDSADAERILRNHLIQAPGDSAALAKLAEMALDQGRIEDSTLLLRRAAASDPAPGRLLALARHLQAHAGPAATLHEIESFPPRLRASFDARAIEAACLGMIGQHDRQISIYQAMCAEQPGNAMLWKSIGDALKTVGRTDEAVAALRSAIAARPAFGEAWWTLSNFKSFRFSDGDVRTMEKLLRSRLTDDDALHFHFALGKAYDDLGRPARAFSHYARGNRLRAAQLGPGDRTVTRFVDQAIATLTPQLFERRAACPAADPIFVVGLHRSGSTLIEQILASHPLIEGTTELPVMQQLSDRLGRKAAAAGRGMLDEVARLGGDELRAIGEEYIERTRPFRLTDRPYFVDKLPANWMNLGLIRMALPNARIIDARRHPMACGFSNFRQHYATGVSFSYSLESIGRFYADYVRLMDHFQQVQPGTVHRVINERLIDDPEGEVRRMLAFLGLPFDPACLESHRNKRAVRTPSAEQVRRPINREGVDYWRRYERWLGPLKEALGDTLERWDKV